MRNIVKSFYNYILSFWYQFLAFIFFIVIASALTIGFVSNSVQIIAITSQINRNETAWDYNIDTFWSDFDNDFVYDYFQKPEAEYFNETGVVLLDYTQLINDGETTIGDYLDQAFEYQRNSNPNKENFIGGFLRRQVFSAAYQNDRRILLPRRSNSGPNQFANFLTVVNREWQVLAGHNYAQMYNLMNREITNRFNATHPDTPILIDPNFVLQYRWDNPELANASSERYNVEPLNLDISNNVVSNLGWDRLRNMRNDEILVNDRFALAHNLKIGDRIKINDFIVQQDDRQQYEDLFRNFQREYTIIGWGMKIQNLFASYDFLNPDRVDNTLNTGFFYVTNEEFENYISYLWYYNNNLVHENGRRERIPYQGNYYHRLRGDAETIRAFNRYLGTQHATESTRPVRTNIRIVFAYSSLFFVQMFNIYLMEGIIFSFVGFIALLFAVLFANYAIKKQLRQMRQQLGLFKAMGYGTMKLATVLWSRTYILLIFGIALGYVISLPIQVYVNRLLVPNFYVVIQAIWLNPYFLASVFLIVPMVLSLLNFSSIIRYLRKNALSMIYMDKNFSMDSHHGKSFSGLNKVYSVRVGKNYLHFSWKNFFMTLFIPIFFALGILLLLVQFNVNTLMRDTVDINSHIYQRAVTYSVSLSEEFLWRRQDEDNRFHLNDENINNLTYVDYTTRQDLIAMHNEDLDSKIEAYLANEDNALLIALQLNELLNYNINHEVLTFTTFINVLEKVVRDYDTYLSDQTPEYEPMINELRRVIELAQDFEGRMINLETQIAFNSAFIRENRDFPLLKLNLYNNDGLGTADNRDLFLVSEQSQRAFVGLDYQLLVREADVNPEELPVIISELFGRENRLEVGDTMQTYLNFVDTSTAITLRIVGINNDKVSNNLYGLQETFLTNFVGQEFPNSLYNTIISRNHLFELRGNDLTTLRFDADYFNFYYSTSEEEVTLQMIFQNQDNLYDYLNWNNITTSNFKSIEFERYLANQTISDVVNLVYILLTFTLILLLTLFVVFFIFGTVDNRMQIQLMKTFGYTNNKISSTLIWRHILSLLLGLIVAVAIDYFIWQLLIRLLYRLFRVLLYNPFTILWTIVAGLIIVGLFFIGAMVSFNIIKKTSPVIK